jgi:hypothetical protein
MNDGRDYKNGKAYFTTSHLSVYAVTYEAAGAEEAEVGDAPYSGGGCDAGTGAAMLAIMGSGALLARRRREN